MQAVCYGGRKKAVAPVLEQSAAVGELTQQWVQCNGARERRRSGGWCWVVGHLQEEATVLIDTRAAKRRWLLQCASCSEREDAALRDESRTYVIIFKYCLRTGDCVNCPVRGLAYIEVNGRRVGDFRIVRHIVGVCC